MAMKTMHEHGLKLDHLTEYTAYPVHMERLNWLGKDHPTRALIQERNRPYSRCGLRHRQHNHSIGHDSEFGSGGHRHVSA